MNIVIRRVGETTPTKTLKTDSVQELTKELEELNKVSAAITLVDKDNIEVTVADNNYCWMPTPAAEY